VGFYLARWQLQTQGYSFLDSHLSNHSQGQWGNQSGLIVRRLFMPWSVDYNMFG